ncbi:hypothetical protein MLD38_011327 [Melastoma candidum]|uniref:Uncharacterized protein n=1 Tax=Melastoma candidum TaxID=119954 RepID=A0ACB9R2S8_9MYRT|nr:hypothetical protein MLD38_011327 [Melastoma candidum]
MLPRLLSIVGVDLPAIGCRSRSRSLELNGPYIACEASSMRCRSILRGCTKQLRRAKGLGHNRTRLKALACHWAIALSCLRDSGSAHRFSESHNAGSLSSSSSSSLQ